MEKFFVNSDGEYLGVFVGREKNGKEIWPEFPKDGVEVPSAPTSGYQVWNFETKSWGNEDLPFEIARQSAYEGHDGLPKDVWGNIDELWKALETAELNGTELPPSASSIIRIRRHIKTDIPKGS